MVHISKNKYIFFIIFISVGLVSSYFIYGYLTKFRFVEIHANDSLNRFNKNFNNEISASKEFAERFVRSYSNIIKKEISPSFYNAFPLANNKIISARLFLSSADETFIYFYPASKSEFFVDCSAYPIQIALYAGLDSPNSGVKPIIPIEELLYRYRVNTGMFNLSNDNIVITISRLTLNSPFPKLFNFSRHSIVILDNVAIELRDDNNNVRRVINEYVGIMTGDRDFSFSLEKAESIGADIAKHHILSLFINSNLFREFLAYKNWSPLVKDILLNMSRANKDITFEYPLWKVKDDIINLKFEANKVGIDTSYIDELFKDPSLAPRDGVLLFYYKDYFGFAVQWITINIGLFLILVALNLYRKNIKATLIPLTNKITPAIVLSINYWVFDSRPKFIDYKYWIIPGIIFVVCMGLCIDNFKTEKAKK